MAETATADAPAKDETPREPCLCGCGKTPTRKRSRFMPGHDAQLKAVLYRTIRDTAVPVADVEAAKAKLDAFGWPQPKPKAVKAVKENGDAES